MARKKRAWNMTNPLYRYLHGRKTTKTARRRRAGGIMARRKGYRRGRGGGLMGMLKPFIAGGIVSWFAPSIPVVNGLPYRSQISGAAGGLIVKRSAIGALAGVAGGTAADYLKGTMGGSSNNAW